LAEALKLSLEDDDPNVSRSEDLNRDPDDPVGLRNIGNGIN